MQAHPLSSSAAHRTPAYPAHFPAATHSSVETTGLLHDLNNLLGALQLYAGLLDRPGVLQPPHQHYATELQTLAANGAVLVQKLEAGVVTPRSASHALEDHAC